MLVEMKQSNQPSVEGKSVGASPITSAIFVWAVGETESRLAYIQKSKVRLLHCLPLRHNVKVAWVTVNHLVMVRVHGPQPLGIGVTGARRSLKPQAKGRHLHPQPFFSSARQPVTSPARHAGIARCDTGADDHF